MTIEKLLNCSADQLEKMTDAELMEWFKPYLSVTRPDMSSSHKANNVMHTRETNKRRHIAEQYELISKTEQAKKLVYEKFGIKIDL